MTAPADRVAAVLDRRHPSYHEPLAVARQWNRSQVADDLAAAADLLRGLAERYPTALVVWYEAALNRMKRGERGKALTLLEAVHDRFGGRLDEDTFCLWGRCYKDAAHAHLDRGLAAPADATPAAVVPEREPASPLYQSGACEAADREYELARARYEQGYAVSGGWFPAVNVAFLTFMRAALAAQMGRPDEAGRLLGVAQQAAEGLAAAAGWPVQLPDDEVWHEATKGEANALLGRWPAAALHYRRARARPGQTPHADEAMGRQLDRIRQGWRLLGRPVPDDLAADLPAARRVPLPGGAATYEPRPIDTAAAVLPPDVVALTERLAEHTHDVWAQTRLRQGWTLGPLRDNAGKRHPCLIPYADLPESEKVYDRNTAMETLKAVLVLGYTVTKPE